MKIMNHSTVELIDSNFSDDMVVKAARVSTKGDKSVGSVADEKLIGYLLKNLHMSPFEHSSATFLVKCPIFTAVQMLRHRSASFNQESGRYRELEDVFFIPEFSRTQHGKPGHYVFTEGTPEQTALMTSEIWDSYSVAYRAYQTMLDAGIAKEIARMVLPVGLMTSLYITFSPRTLMMFLNLRADKEAQEEIREVAELMKAEFKMIMPVTYDAWSNL